MQEIVAATEPIIETFIFLMGIVLGSFLNVCIHRLPRGQSVVRPASACPGCGHRIRWYDNIPVLSWLLLRGRCRDCSRRISPRYLFVELATGLMFLAAYATFGFTLATLKFCIFFFLLLGLIFTDAETKLLPDLMTLPGLAIGLVFSLFVPVSDIVTRYVPNMLAMQEPSWRLLSLADAALAALIGAGFMYGVGAAYLRLRQVEGMGLGDVKLMAMIGAFTGLKATLLTIFGASILGSVFGLAMIPWVWLKRTRRRLTKHKEPMAIARRRAWESARKVYRFYAMPFGVFLGAMAILVTFFGNSLINWYWTRFW